MGESLRLLEDTRRNYISENWEYKCAYWDEFDYRFLQNTLVRKYKSYKHDTYNDITIMIDTETSKKREDKYEFLYKNGEFYKKQYVPYDNHVVIWTLSIRLFELDIVTLYGRKPSELCKCISKILEQLHGNNTPMFIHNLSYDHVFLRKFFYREFGKPIEQLNTKSHYPIQIKFENGLILKDSLILAQRTLERWAKDMKVPAQKAVGDWDYNVIRNQSEEITEQEMHYAEFDTLAGTQCIDALKVQLHKHIGDMPFTNTGILREILKKIGAENAAKKLFKQLLVSFNDYQILRKIFHGGYVHGNRHYLMSNLLYGIQGFDFASSYPFILLTHKFPMSKFVDLKKDVDIDYILRNKEDHAFMFRLTMIDVKLKDESWGMPPLQFSKCEKTLNAVVDNGRILAAQIVSLYTNEIDLELIDKYYEFSGGYVITEVKTAKKDYLPKWFRDIVFQLFVDKTKLKHVDDILYTIQKFKINSCYGLTVMRWDKEVFLELFEDTTIDGEEYKAGDYVKDKSKTAEDVFNETVKKRSTILPYQWGVWVTSYAMRNLFELGSCCKVWLYSDTDSVYGVGWNKVKVKKYNQKCINMVKAAGYTGVEHEGKVYWLGVAETERKDKYSKFKYMGAKRYCGRSKVDNKLHLTVAGVPKSAVKCLHSNIVDFRYYRYKLKYKNSFNLSGYKLKKAAGCSSAEFIEYDLRVFEKGFNFEGEKTGKLMHSYLTVDDIYIDENGNETGDSVDLSPCDYELDKTEYHSLDEYLNVVDEITIDFASEEGYI